MKRESFVFAGCQLPLIAAALTISAPAVNAAEEATVFARVDDVVITREEFEREVYSAARQTYYHGRPPSGEEFIEFRKDVADRLIDRQLLLMEARRRNLEPDHQSVDAKIAGYEARYAGTERWQNEGPKMIAALQSRFEEDSLLAALEAEVRSVEEPEPSELREYYDDNADLFTEPARNRVSIILLGVPPSASAAAWGEAREEARRILGRLEDGAAFEELARMHSSDATASAGGDMGYLHAGMLSTNAEQAIAALSIGEVSEPVQVLEGMAIFKLTEQQPERLRSFDDVRDRAGELWLRDKGDQDWEMLVAKLRSVSRVSVDTDYLVSLPDTTQ
ncbi:MAG TPA: peptidylprolyl isomerase [Woeseiaceae bacterium]|jgi:parvulin-like peptidyl-prolyl isomerase|nr:peptidylprolyl isomerase [Woeseiaceae bacterium]